MSLPRLATVILSLLVSLGAASAAKPAAKEIALKTLRDKIAGGWAGQMIGVSYGAPTEFKSNGKINDRELPKWTPDRVSNSLEQDDLYVDMTFAKVLDEKGLNATTADFGAMFRGTKFQLWHANLAARRALSRGVSAELAGTPRYNAHANDIDFQIESDFIGLITPGMPQTANDIAWRAGRVVNSGDGLYGGMLMAGMYSAAFFESDPRRVVEAGLRSMPQGSPYAAVIRDVLAWSAQEKDWRKVWQLLQDKWDRRDPCPEGALRPFNIDAKLNGAYVVLGLLYGERDMGKTIDIATRSGQDSDCNPSTAAGILGVMLGYEAIPELWKGGIPAIADSKFSYTDATFHTIVESTLRGALAAIKANGGRVDGEMLQVSTQRVKPVKLDIWDNYGSPVERISTADARWKFAGGWTTSVAKRWDTDATDTLKTASMAGSEATIQFTGTGFIAAGPLMPNGGKLEAFLDGNPLGAFDAYSGEESTKSSDAIVHRFGLTNKSHTLRIVALGEPFPGSAGALVTLQDLIVYR